MRLTLMRWLSCAALSGPVGGAAQGAGGEFGDQVALEVLGAALVGEGVAVLGGDFPGFLEAVVVGGAAAQVVLGLGGDEVLGADGGQAEARFFYVLPARDRQAPAAAIDQSPTRRDTFSYALPVPGRSGTRISASSSPRPTTVS